jgi:hypothetical protein
MIRTQVQLTEEQMAALKRQAAASGRSVADLVREGVDLFLRSGNAPSEKQRQARALEAAGRFASGLRDVSTNHDRHLAEAYGE